MSEQIDIDRELAEALKALRAARSHLLMASYGFDELAQADQDRLSAARAGQLDGIAWAIANQVDAASAATRRLRTTAKSWKGRKA